MFSGTEQKLWKTSLDMPFSQRYSKHVMLNCLTIMNW